MSIWWFCQFLFSCCYNDENNKLLSSHKIFYWSLLKAKKPRVFSENCKSLQLIKGTKKRFVKKQRQGFRSTASSEYYANVRISKKNIAKIIYLTIVDFPKSERIFYIIRIKRTTCRLDRNQSLRLWTTQANALIIRKKFFLQVYLLSHFGKIRKITKKLSKIDWIFDLDFRFFAMLFFLVSGSNLNKI